jgi:hypothetical protein
MMSMGVDTDYSIFRKAWMYIEYDMFNRKIHNFLHERIVKRKWKEWESEHH